jgi:PilZ domain
MSIEARRHTPRVRLNQAAYIKFGSGTRGLVLDVSEKGLRFQTESAFECAEPVRFRLTSDNDYAGEADLAWTDESRTMGGLRFTSVSPEIGAQIRSWMDGDPSAYPAIQDGAMAGAGSSLELVRDTSDMSEAAEGEAVAIPMGRLGEKGSSLSMFPLESTATGGLAYTAPPRSGAQTAAVMFLVLLFVAGGVVGALSYLYPRQARDQMARIEDSVTRFLNFPSRQGLTNPERAGIGDSQPALESAPTPASPDVTGPMATTAAAPVTAPSDGKASPQQEAAAATSAQEITAPNPLSIAAGSAEAKQGRNNSQADMALAQTYLNESSTPERNAKGVELLWLATEKGNVDAEIQLADLYTRGVAVPKSCVQARILLKAAASANPAAAKEKLDQLGQGDCR